MQFGNAFDNAFVNYYSVSYCAELEMFVVQQPDDAAIIIQRCCLSCRATARTTIHIM